MIAPQKQEPCGVDMRKGGRDSLWVVAILVVLSFGVWAYYVSIYFKHIYTLTACSQGQIALIPKYLCRTYLYHFRGTKNDIDQINYDGSLFEIISGFEKEDQTKLLSFFIEKGVGINELNGRTGTSPLHEAVLDNNLEVTELLLTHGANPLVKDKKRSLTPLDLALQLKGRLGQPDRTAVIECLERTLQNYETH